MISLQNNFSKEHDHHFARFYRQV
uniref:Uncharacterized protein n=1 Tax=Arundo donax TaxID=35708 RepID=A0A0A9BQX6_ARUDO